MATTKVRRRTATTTATTTTAEQLHDPTARPFPVGDVGHHGSATACRRVVGVHGSRSITRAGQPGSRAAGQPGSRAVTGRPVTPPGQYWDRGRRRHLRFLRHPRPLGRRPRLQLRSGLRRSRLQAGAGRPRGLLLPLRRRRPRRALGQRGGLRGLGQDAPARSHECLWRGRSAGRAPSSTPCGSRTGVGWWPIPRRRRRCRPCARRAWPSASAPTGGGSSTASSGRWACSIWSMRASPRRGQGRASPIPASTLRPSRRSASTRATSSSSVTPGSPTSGGHGAWA